MRDMANWDKRRQIVGRSRRVKEVARMAADRRSADDMRSLEDDRRFLERMGEIWPLIRKQYPSPADHV